jgi:DNA invertase Pin-like site-specific DNA recombinase
MSSARSVLLMNRAAIYVRITPLSGQTESQVAQLREIAKVRGLDVVRVYTDQVWRAEARRPSLTRLLSEARKGQFQIVVVHSLVDIARTLRHCLEVVRGLNQLGIGVISCQDGLCISGEQTDGSARIVGALHEVHRSLVSEAVRSGMRRSRLDGIPLGRRPVVMDREAILRDRTSGMSFASIGKKHGIGKATAFKVIADAGLTSSSAPMSTAQSNPFQ